MELTPEKITKIVCDYFHEDITKVYSTARDKSVIKAKHLAIYFCEELLNLSCGYTATKFTGKTRRGTLNHATILHALRSVRNQRDTDAFYAKNFYAIEKMLKNEIRITEEEFQENDTL